MASTTILNPTSHVQFGLARVDITPPVGIYHGFWGPACHDRATAVHRSLSAEVMAFGPVGAKAQIIRAQLDLVGLVKDTHEDLRAALSETSGLPLDQIVITYSHSHAAGWFVPDRYAMPGGELIPAYLADLKNKLRYAARQALAALQEVYLSYATGRCNLAANRDFWDEANQRYVVSTNPARPADDTVLVARVCDRAGQLLATLVNYACHTTTLAWQNTRLSPDYVGAMREKVEQETGRPCIFLLGACGDLGPKEGFIGDPAIADRNGRQLAHAALSALESLGPAATDFSYQGPVISAGAALGPWAAEPLSVARQAQVKRFTAGRHTVELPLKARPDPLALQQELEQWLARQAAADERGDALEARDWGARAERNRRWLARLQDLPEGDTYAYHYSVHRMGDALWITCGGEPYSALQVELRRRFPDLVLLISPLSGDLQVAYLLEAECYGQGIYQEDPSILAPGCLETLIESVTAQIEAITSS
jgi:hypothetical protein